MRLTQSQALEIRENFSVLAGATLGAIIGVTGLFYYTSSVFFDSIREDVGWSLKQLSLVYTAFAITSALLSPVAGAILDRFGSRGPIGLSLMAMVVCFTLLGTLPAAFSLYIGLHTLLAVLGSAATTVGFSRIVSTRFDKARGLAIGVVTAGPGIFATVAPAAIGALVRHQGWRSGYFALAIAVAFLGCISVLLIGPGRSANVVASRGSGHEVSAFKGLLQRREFWLLLAVFGIASVFGGGYVPHFIPLLKSKGFDQSSASALASILGLGLLFGRFASGWLMDRIFAPHVGAGTLILFSIGLIMLLEGDSRLMTIAAFALGFSLGSEIDVLAYLVSRYFPVKDFGKTYGLIYGLAIGSSAFSPLLISYLAAGNSGYNRALIVCCIAMLVAGGLLLLAPRYTSEASGQGYVK